MDLIHFVSLEFQKYSYFLKVFFIQFFLLSNCILYKNYLILSFLLVLFFDKIILKFTIKQDSKTRSNRTYEFIYIYFYLYIIYFFILFIFTDLSMHYTYLCNSSMRLNYIYSYTS